MELPRVGTTHETSFIVDSQQTVTLPGLPAVVATPWLVWHLEMTALSLLAPSLPEGQISMGTRIELDHLAPAPEGAEITCRARVIHVDGLVVNFQVEASDASEVLSRGVHKRQIVDVERMSRRIAKKTGVE